MAIVKHGRAYWLDVRIDGRRIRRSLHTDSYHQAKTEAERIEAELREKAERTRVGTAWADFVPRYLAWAAETKPASLAAERSRARKIREFFERADAPTLQAVTPYHVEQLRAHVRERDRRTKDKPPRPAEAPAKPKGNTRATANRYCALLRTMFNRAADWGIFTGPNPVSKVKFFRERTKVEPAQPDEMARVLEAAEAIAREPWSPVQARIVDLILFALNTGLRRRELLSVRWRDVQDDSIRVVGKGDKARRVPLNRPALAVLARQPRDGPYVFPLSNREQPDALRRTVARIRKISGVPHFHWHLCRHYFTSQLLARGVDIQTTAELLGHASLVTTQKYAHTSPERCRSAVAALEADGRKRGHRPLDFKREKKPRKPVKD